jgi:plastocyanin
MTMKVHKAVVRVVVSLAFLSALCLLLLPLPAAAAKASSPRTWQAQVAVDSKDHAIQGMAFLPGVLWINVGDTVVWTVKSGEIHTVTFLKPGQTPPAFNPQDPLHVLPQGSHRYDGKSYYNSGILATLPAPGFQIHRTYALTFGVGGDFTYYCLVHPSMIGIIHVRPAGTSYPFSQEDYNRQIAAETSIILRDGRTLDQQAKASSTNLHVTDGIGDGLATIMRFYPQHIVIHVGQTITFVNRDPMEPHTVTYGADQPSGNFAPYGNPKTFDGSKPLNSGFLGTDPHWFGTTYQVRFVKAGTFAFRCDLHDYLGMVATIVVKS